MNGQGSCKVQCTLHTVSLLSLYTCKWVQISGRGVVSYSLVCNRLGYQAICQVLLHKSPKVVKECYQNVELATQGTFMQHPVCTYTCHNQITLCS